VLKPQREGGGNNFYGGAIRVFLGSLRANEHDAWIAMGMAMIEAPHEVGRYLVRAPARVQAPRRSFEQMSFLSWASLGMHCVGVEDAVGREVG
jgi:hypothetical protein